MRRIEPNGLKPSCSEMAMRTAAAHWGDWLLFLSSERVPEGVIEDNVSVFHATSVHLREDQQEY